MINEALNIKINYLSQIHNQSDLKNSNRLNKKIDFNIQSVVNIMKSHKVFCVTSYYSNSYYKIFKEFSKYKQSYLINEKNILDLNKKNILKLVKNKVLIICGFLVLNNNKIFQNLVKITKEVLSLIIIGDAFEFYELDEIKNTELLFIFDDKHELNLNNLYMCNRYNILFANNHLINFKINKNFLIWENNQFFTNKNNLYYHLKEIIETIHSDTYIGLFYDEIKPHKFNKLKIHAQIDSYKEGLKNFKNKLNFFNEKRYESTIVIYLSNFKKNIPYIIYCINHIHNIVIYTKKNLFTNIKN